MNKLQMLRQEIVEQCEKRLAWIDKQQAEYGPLLDELEKLSPQLVNVEDGWISFNLVGDKHLLNAAFGLMRRHGYEPYNRPEKNSSTYSTHFKKENVDGLVFFSFSSTQCRRVKTGTRTRTVEEDVYEIVCDEQEYPEMAPQQHETESVEMPF